jgi:sigma-B regulation protein RsbU (phosphoserine phosphatase)
VDVAVSWRPAQAVSGDFYFVDSDPGGGLVVCIADVSGKGFGPALLMANLQAVLEAGVEAGAGPAGICTRLNQFVVRHAATGRFVTLVIVRVDPTSGGRVNPGTTPERSSGTRA